MPLSDPNLPPPPPGVPPTPGSTPGGPTPPLPGSGGYGGTPQPPQPGQWGQPGPWGQPPAQPYVPAGPPGAYRGYGPPPAEPGKRLIARIIDFVIFIVVWIALWILVVVVMLADATSTTSNTFDDLNFGANIASWLITLGMFVVYWLYESLMAASRGQTIGKMIMKLRITDSAGDKLSIGAAMKRSLVWLVPLVPCCLGYIGFLVIEIWGIVNMFNRPDRLTLMDQFADSTVTYA